MTTPQERAAADFDCGEAGHADGCCGNASCLPSVARARRKATALQEWHSQALELVKALEYAAFGVRTAYPSLDTVDKAHDALIAHLSDVQAVKGQA